MTDMQHYVVMTSLLRPFDAANDAVTPTFSDVVLASDAEAAIAAAVNDFRDAMSESVWYQSGRECGYDEGQRDALAEAVQRVEAIPRGKVMSDGIYSAFTLSHEEVIAAIRGDSDESA